jgi:hypothetical protein
VLPGRLFEALAERWADLGEPWESEDELVPADLVQWVAGPSGVVAYADGAAAPSCPVAAELLRFSAW